MEENGLNAIMKKCCIMTSMTWRPWNESLNGLMRKSSTMKPMWKRPCLDWIAAIDIEIASFTWKNSAPIPKAWTWPVKSSKNGGKLIGTAGPWETNCPKPASKKWGERLSSWESWPPKGGLRGWSFVGVPLDNSFWQKVARKNVAGIQKVAQKNVEIDAKVARKNVIIRKRLYV